MTKNIALIFDLDGTLIDSVFDIALEISKLLNEEGLPSITANDAKNMVGEGAKIFVKRAFEKSGHIISEYKLEEYFERYMHYYRNSEVTNTVLYDGVSETLSNLRKKGYKTAICTNKPQIPTEKVLNNLKIKNLFDVVLTAESTPLMKPDPMPLLEAQKLLNCEKAVMIGDSPPDLRAGKAAEIPVILMTYGYSRIPYSELEADVLLDDFKKLEGVINEKYPN
ncbi:MAG: HAD-IA family hydrolase [Alphaproteobacteria bacterium]